MWFLAITIIIMSLIIDLILDEPPRRIHPVVWMGKLISYIDRKIPRGDRRIEIVAGLFMCLAVTIIFTLLFTGFLAIIRRIFGVLPWMLASAFLLKTTFAIKDMRNHVEIIANYINKNDLEAARYAVSMIVSRSVKNLDYKHIISASIESTAENTVDSVISPFFSLGLSGVPLAVMYRSINTLDAMIGYKNNKYVNVGLVSAKLDDILNWLPARLSVLFIIFASYILRIPRKNGCLSINAIFKDASKFDSPNSGFPISTMARVLGIKLEKIGHYCVGVGHLPCNTKYLFEALRIMEITSILFIMLIAAPLYVLIGIHMQIFFEDILYDIIMKMV